MAAPVTRTVTGSSAAQSTPIRCNNLVTPFNATVRVEVAAGTATYNVEGTIESANNYADVATFNANAKWFPISTSWTAQTATLVGLVSGPIEYLRLNCTAMSSATVNLSFEQAGI